MTLFTTIWPKCQCVAKQCHFLIFVIFNVLLAIFHPLPGFHGSPRGWICTGFGTAVDVADIITCDKFLAIGWGTSILQGSQFADSHRTLQQSPLTQGWRFRAASNYQSGYEELQYGAIKLTARLTRANAVLAMAMLADLSSSSMIDFL